MKLPNSTKKTSVQHTKKTTPNKDWYYYGTHAVQALLEYRAHEIKQIWLDKKHTVLAKMAQNASIAVQWAQTDTLTDLAGSAHHGGAVAYAKAMPMLGDDDLVRIIDEFDDGVIVLLDQVSDPTNLGAILRTCAAMGVRAVVVPRHGSALLSPLVAKIAVGAGERVPFVVASNLVRAIELLKDSGVFVYGTALDTQAKPLWDNDFSGKIGLVMGAEGDGIRTLTAKRCDGILYIPIDIESLNVGATTAMALYEIVRQRAKTQ